MLPVVHRVRTAADFARTVRSGARSGHRNVVLYGLRQPDDQISRAGFIVGKNVGNAVTRNVVKRRLRYIAAEWIQAHPRGFVLVVRALPEAAMSDSVALRTDFDNGVAVTLRKLNRADPPRGAGRVS